MKKISLVLSMALMSTSVFAAEIKSANDIRQKFDNCTERHSSTLGMRQCTAKAQVQANALLTKAIAGTITKYENEKEALERFFRTEAAWGAYVEAECSFQSAEMLGGSGESLIFDSCKVDQTLKRADALTKANVQE